MVLMISAKLRKAIKTLHIMHLNILYIASHIDDLKTFLSLLDVKFEIICISESRITKALPLITSISLLGYNIDQITAGQLLVEH